MRKGTPRRFHAWLAVAQILLFCLTFITPVHAATDSFADDIDLLTSYGIVRGDTQGNLNLDKAITRAEMITIMVRALGAEEQAKLFQGYGTFQDAKGHWAEANIAYAAAKELVKGDGNGFVRPQDSITYGEALTLILRVLGKEPTSGTWPLNALIAASSLGLVPEGVNGGNLNQTAVRGKVFQSLARGLQTVETEDGTTVLQRYVDNKPPVLTLSALPDSTTGSSVSVSGSVDDATSVTVNGKAVSLAGQKFSTIVNLEYGDNTIQVVAADRAGNQTTEVRTVARAHPIATLDIAGPDKVRPSGTASYIITAKDSKGRVIGLEGVTAKVEGNIGTFNLSTGAFTAAPTPGKGKITLNAGSLLASISVEVMGLDSSASRLSIRPVNDGNAVSYTKPMTVVVEVLNAQGALAANDYGRPIVLSASGIPGLTVSPSTAYTEGGLATFAVRGTSMGFVSLTASTGALPSDNRVAEFGSNLRVRLSADPNSLSVGGATTIARIRATLVDEKGTSVTNNTGSDLIIQLSSAGSDGSLIGSYIRIIRNTSSSASSGEEGMFSVGAQAGQARITGVVTSGQNITVDPTAVSISIPTVGSGSFWDIIGSLSLTKSLQSNLLVRLSDARGSTIPGAYAYTVSLSTSNNDPKVDGIPSGVELYMGNTRLTNTSQVLRTSGGVATMKILYNKPGQVTLTISPAASTSTALSTDGTTGVAASSGVPARTFTFSVGGTVAGVKLLADSDALGTDRNVAATSASNGRPVTLRVYLTDSEGNWIPNTTGTATLSLSAGGDGSNTTQPTNLSSVISNGKATFTVYPTTIPGTDTYTVSATVGASTFTSGSIPVMVQSTAPAQPAIIAARGINNGIPGALNMVNPDDTGLELELAQDTNQDAVVVKIYVEGGYSPIFTSDPISLNQAAPRITIPKSALLTGIRRYQVIVRNGVGDSARSTASAQVTNSVYTSSISISSARYQRSTNTLTIYGGSYGSSDTINPALIQITDSSTGQQRTLAGAAVTSISSGQIVLDLSTSTYLLDIETPTLFSGSDVLITAASGWYTRANGEQSRDITTGAPMTPMAHVTHAEYDRTNSRLYLIGAGFNGVTLNFNKIKLVSSTDPAVTLSGSGASRLSDTQWVIPINSTVIAALDGAGGYELTLEDDWAYNSSWTMPGIPTVNVYAQVAVTSVNYVQADSQLVISGSGFTDGTITVGNLKLVDLSATPNGTALSGSYTITGDTTITITLSPDILLNSTAFQGSDVYLIGSPGWFQKPDGRQSAGIPSRTLRLPTINP